MCPRWLRSALKKARSHHNDRGSVLEGYWSYQPCESKGQMRSGLGNDITHDDFRLNRHCGWEELILPQASAMVSNARSNRNSGL